MNSPAPRQFIATLMVTGLLSASPAWAAIHHQITMGMTVQREIYAGAELDTALRANLSETTNAGLQYYVQRIGQRLAAQSPVYYPFHFIVLDDARSANAYVVPGGFIYVTTGLINMTENESQLAALLSHQMAHVIKRHLVKDLQVEAGSDWERLGSGRPDYSQAAQDRMSQLVEYLINHSFFPEEEVEADMLAMRMMTKAGYNPIGLQQLLEKLQAFEQNGVFVAYSQNHPVPPARIEVVQEYLSTVSITESSLILDSQEFHDLVP